jgi:hypothetical protein
VQRRDQVEAGAPAVPEHQLAEDDLELPPLETFLGDDLARRAFRAALFGCLAPCGPFTLYSLWLLLRLSLYPGGLSPAGMRRRQGALLLDEVVCLFWLMFCGGRAVYYG